MVSSTQSDAASGHQPHNGLTQQAHLNTARGVTYDTSLHDTLLKHGATDLNVFSDTPIGGDDSHLATVTSQVQQLEGDGQPREEDTQAAARPSEGLAQAFCVDMGSQSSSQRTVQGNTDMHGYFCSSLQGPDSQRTFQGQPENEKATHSAQMMDDQAHAVNVQLKTESCPVVERHQVRSYPSSPPSRHQMLTQSDLRSFEGGVKPAEGRHVPSHRPSHSLGQAAAFMSGVPNREMFAHNHVVSAPVSPSEGFGAGPFPVLFHYMGQRQEIGPNLTEHSPMFNQNHQIALRNPGQFSRSCAPSIRSTSPSASMASTSITSISPLGSARINPDGSFTSQETSFDSLSNAASGSFSRASSTSEDVFSYELGSLGLSSSLRMSKQKKKLLNIDRKMICDYSVANPNVKQDAIANEFGIERSTVSKILKQKDKWLAIDPRSDAAKIAKHRAVKFPAVEDRLTRWVAQSKAQGEPIRDSHIRTEALRIARELGLGEDKFKASGGWIEKFRERHAIPKPSADIPSKTPQGSEQQREPIPSSSTGAVVLAPQPESQIESAVGSADMDGQSQPARRQSVRGSKAKGTPQKRARDEEKTQLILGVSPLSHDLARMQFHQNGAPASMPDAAFFRPNFYEGHQQLPQQAEQHSDVLHDGIGIPQQPQFLDDADHERKRRRAMQEFQGQQAAMGLGPAIEFQFPAPQPGAPGPSSQMTMSSQLCQAMSQGETSPQKGSPRSRRAAAKPVAAGRTRRGKGRLSNANHTPQTPSPLSMSPADGRGAEINLHGLDPADAEQYTAAALERLRVLSSDKSSIVTAQQAQQSLETVLRFLSEQPSGFVPTNHFVVFGHLQANIEQKIKDHSSQSPVSEESGSQPHLEDATQSYREAVAANSVEQ
nr:-dna-bind-domain-containing protein [Melanopsichium pennsylvanicum 4]